MRAYSGCRESSSALNLACYHAGSSFAVRRFARLEVQLLSATKPVMRNAPTGALQRCATQDAATAMRTGCGSQTTSDQQRALGGVPPPHVHFFLSGYVRLADKQTGTGLV